jgi:branched-chain amino acid transport system permease protein
LRIARFHSGKRRVVRTYPLLKPGLEAVALVVAVCVLTAAVSLAFGLSGQRLMTLFCVNVCAVLAFQVFSGNTGVVSFGHTAFMGVGAYVSAWLTMPAAIQRTALPNLPSWLAGHELSFLVAIFAVLAAGLLLGMLSGMPIARLGGASASIATLGFLIIVYSILAASRDFTRGNQTFYGVPRVTDVVMALSFACLFVIVARLFKDSSLGLMTRATRDNETAAVSVGVNPRRMRYAAWVLSGGMAAVAGALYGHMLGAFTPKDFYFHLAFTYVAMLIVGGMNTVTGAVAGVGLVMFIQELLRNFERASTSVRSTFPRSSGSRSSASALRCSSSCGGGPRASWGGTNSRMGCSGASSRAMARWPRRGGPLPHRPMRSGSTGRSSPSPASRRSMT